MTAAIHNDPDKGRFTMETEHGVAYADYARDGDVLVFTHTLVPKSEQGHGVGTHLIAAVLDQVRDHGQKIVPQCPFVRAYVDDHPEVSDLIA